MRLPWVISACVSTNSQRGIPKEWVGQGPEVTLESTLREGRDANRQSARGLWADKSETLYLLRRGEVKERLEVSAVRAQWSLVGNRPFWEDPPRNGLGD